MEWTEMKGKERKGIQLNRIVEHAFLFKWLSNELFGTACNLYVCVKFTLWICIHSFGHKWQEEKQRMTKIDYKSNTNRRTHTHRERERKKDPKWRGRGIGKRRRKRRSSSSTTSSSSRLLTEWKKKRRTCANHMELTHKDSFYYYYYAWSIAILCVQMHCLCVRVTVDEFVHGSTYSFS